MMNEVLRVTALGEFIWHPEADRLIEEGDFGGSPSMPFILKALRRKKWIGLTDEEAEEVERWVEFKEEGSGRIPTGKLIRYIEAKLKEKNG